MRKTRRESGQAATEYVLVLMILVGSFLILQAFAETSLIDAMLRYYDDLVNTINLPIP